MVLIKLMSLPLCFFQLRNVALQVILVSLVLQTFLALTFTSSIIHRELLFSCLSNSPCIPVPWNLHITSKCILYSSSWKHQQYTLGFGRGYKIKLRAVRIRKKVHRNHTTRFELWQRYVGLQKKVCEIDLIMFSSSLLAYSVRASLSTERFTDVKVIQPGAYY